MRRIMTATVVPLSDLDGRIREIVIEESDWKGKPGSLHPGLDLIGGGVLDSIGIFQVIARVQHEYGIEIRDDEIHLDNLESVGSIARLVESKQLP